MLLWFNLMVFVKGKSTRQLRLIISQMSIPLPWRSIILPATNGAINALIAKHWENKAIAMPLCSMGEIFVIASVAVGRKAANAIAKGIWAIKTKITPSFNTDEIPSSRHPMPKLEMLIPSPKPSL